MTAFIRKAVKTDVDQIKSCAEAAYTIYTQRIGRKPAPMVADFATSIDNGNLFVAEDTGKISGFVVFYARGDHVHLENVAVHPDFQQRGIGLLLINFAEQRARESGLKRIELYTNAMMTENLEIYPRLGYQQFDRRVEDGFDRVYFKKSL